MNAIGRGETPAEYSLRSSIRPFVVRLMILSGVLALRHSFGRPLIVPGPKSPLNRSSSQRTTTSDRNQEE